jgi:hypothetical protein
LQHQDAKCQYSVILAYGRSIVSGRSAKIHTQTLSPAESEQHSTTEAGTYAVWTNQFAEDIGYPLKHPIILYHDNEASVWMSINGGHFNRTKHFLARINFVRELVTNKTIQLRTKPADMGTKPQTGQQLTNHLRTLGITRGEYEE